MYCTSATQQQPLCLPLFLMQLARCFTPTAFALLLRRFHHSSPAFLSINNSSSNSSGTTFSMESKANMSSRSNLHEPANEDSSSSSSSSSPRRLSQDEMRARRLRALGQAVAPGLLAASAIPREEIQALLGSQNRSNSEKPPAKQKKNNNNNEVIELLDSDSEEDDGKSSPQRRGRPAKHQSKATIEVLDTSSDDDDSDNDRKSKKKAAIAPAAKQGTKNQKPVDNPYSRKRKAAPAASRATKGSNSSNTFQVATWNVWFGPQGDGNPHPGPRMRALCRMLHEQHSGASPLLFVGFQEVVDPLATYLKASMEGAGYTFFRQTGAHYGCALAVHNSLTVIDQGWCPYNETAMTRGFLYVRAQLPHSSRQQILFTTTHLESWTGDEYTGSAQRPRQLKQMETFCNRQLSAHQHLSVAIMTGDCNWDDERPGRSVPLDPKMSTVLSSEWQDSWLTAPRQSPKDTCYTYDGKVNPMLGNNLRRRFDRVLLSSLRNNSNSNRDAAARAVSTALLGTRALPDLTWEKYNPYKRSYKTQATAPSDHFGYLVRVRMMESEE